MKPTDLPSLNHLRAVAAPEGALARSALRHVFPGALRLCSAGTPTNHPSVPISTSDGGRSPWVSSHLRYA